MSTIPASRAGASRVAVTGAASGIGAATARLLQSKGWRVACLDRNLAGARATADPDGLAVEVDVADEARQRLREPLADLAARASVGFPQRPGRTVRCVAECFPGMAMIF